MLSTMSQGLDGISAYDEAPPGPVLELNRDSALDGLARRLYWNQCRLDPGIEDEPWEGLSERERHFYKLLVEDLVSFEELIEAARKG